MKHILTKLFGGAVTKMNGRMLEFKFENKVNGSPCLHVPVYASLTRINVLLKNGKAEQAIPLSIPHFLTQSPNRKSKPYMAPNLKSIKLPKYRALYTS